MADPKKIGLLDWISDNFGYEAKMLFELELNGRALHPTDISAAQKIIILEYDDKFEALIEPFNDWIASVFVRSAR